MLADNNLKQRECILTIPTKTVLSTGRERVIHQFAVITNCCLSNKKHYRSELKCYVQLCAEEVYVLHLSNKKHNKSNKNTKIRECLRSHFNSMGKIQKKPKTFLNDQFILINKTQHTSLQTNHLFNNFVFNFCYGKQSTCVGKPLANCSGNYK